MPKNEIALKINRSTRILDLLAEHFPEVKSGLVYENPYQLYVATVLSAQTTDVAVNRTTVKLFREIPGIDALAETCPAGLERYIKTLGLYRSKSRYLVEGAKIIQKEFGGKIPEDFDQLLTLPGVGRKTANVIISGAFNQPGLAVDTHVFRVSKRLALAKGKDPDRVELELKKIVPEKLWSITHHRLITFGRQICHARKPDCPGCFLAELCPAKAAL